MPGNKYNVIVVGGGHAGTEAALACARMGCKTLLVSIRLDTLGEMSCNPAIGGLAKGHLVKEIDALGGIMARAADYGCIQFKRLNTSKGPAVRSSRAQEDRKKYKKFIIRKLKEQENLYLMEGCVSRLLYKNGMAKGVEISGSGKLYSDAVIITPGTFLNGTIHIGLRNFPGGRIGEKASVKLSDSLRGLGLRMLRFKTGTCARLDGRTIDFSGLKVQEGDEKPIPFSFMTKKLIKKQKPCYITYTNKTTHDIIRAGFDRSPLFTGVIEGTGVRYCPSIEDKIVKFSHMDRHHVFLEPEGLDTDLYYPNGVSTSLPEDVQEKFLRSIPGLENVKIARFGYGIEHDVADPTELHPTLETKKLKNLYLAGQINGTTGYEEAAAQGLVAGINAAAELKGMEPFILQRHEAYTGVLIDDLVTKGTTEPYRMFTSRAEYRLLLREDNTHLRLTDIGYKYGSVKEPLYSKVNRFREKLESGRKIIENIKVKKDSGMGREFGIKKTVPLKSLLRQPNVKWNDLRPFFPALKRIEEGVAEELDIEIKYEGYIKKQEIDIMKMKKMEDWKITDEISYNSIGSLSGEIVEKLNRVKPRTLGQASRISGVTPAAITNIMVHLKGNQKNKPRPCKGIKKN